MPSATPGAAGSSAAASRGIIEESVEALAETFRASRLFPATLGLAVTLAVALSFSALAGMLLVRNLLGEASLALIVGGLTLYAGLLLTYGALCRIVAVERTGESMDVGAAFVFALSRIHVVVGLPFFTLLVALGLGALAVKIGYETGLSGAGPSLGPLAMLAIFAVNLVLILVLLLTHTLTGPCVACTELAFSEVGARLIRVAQERLHEFLAHQAAVLVIGLPLVALATAVFVGAFAPAFCPVASGRLRAEALRAEPPPRPSSEARPALPPQPQRHGRLGTLRRWAESDLPAAGGAPLVGVGALAVLLLGVIPLAFAAAAQTSVYLGLTGDQCAAGAKAAAPAETEAGAVLLVERRPPTVHCWRCDAINRFGDERCAKCGARYVTCPHCFATNQFGRTICASCGRTLPLQEIEVVGTSSSAGGR